MKHAREDYNRIQDPENLIPENEPVFLLRAKDKVAPHVVRYWAQMAKAAGAADNITEAALAQVDRMIEWQSANGSQVPDMP